MSDLGNAAVLSSGLFSHGVCVTSAGHSAAAKEHGPSLAPWMRNHYTAESSP